MTPAVGGPDGTADPAVEVEDGAVAFGDRPVLRHVSVTVRRREAVAILGSNGAGKSTLVKAMVGLVPLRSGSASLFGTPLAHFRDWSRLGYVPQRASAASGVPATVREVVAAGRLGGRGRLGGCRISPSSFVQARRADRRAVTAAIEAVGLADRTRDAVADLSGGQQQRVLIARALAREPDLFVLDEPVAGVDLPSQQALAAVLAELGRRGAAVVLVAHELGPLEPLIDRAIVLRGGRVVYEGPPPPAGDVHRIGGVHHHHHGDHSASDRPSRPTGVPTATGPWR